jgi:hypothetical protein
MTAVIIFIRCVPEYVFQRDEYARKRPGDVPGLQMLSSRQLSQEEFGGSRIHVTQPHAMKLRAY